MAFLLVPPRQGPGEQHSWNTSTSLHSPFWGYQATQGILFFKGDEGRGIGLDWCLGCGVGKNS